MTELDRQLIEATAALLPGGRLHQITAINPRVRRIATQEHAVIVKTFRPGHTRAFHRELAGADLARAAVAPWVPAILDSGILPSGHHYVIYTEVPGCALDTPIKTTHVDRSQALTVLGTILRQFHQSTRTGYGPVDQSSAVTAHELITTHATHRASLLAARNEPGLAAILTRIANRLVSTTPDPGDAVLCHGDLHLSNVIGITSPSGFTVRGVVDYESVIFAFPEYDLAKSIAVCSAYHPDERNVLTTGYAQPITHDVLDDLVTYHTIDGWLWAVLIEGRDHHLWSTRLANLHPSP